MEDKVPLFNGAGYVFASVNYRLTDTSLPPPAPQYPVHDQDTADAMAWLIQHADEIGADAGRIAVFGHSAGGGIVSAIATDDQYLGRDGLPLTALTCVGSMDGEGYDIVAGATTTPPEVQTGYRRVFGTDPTCGPRHRPSDTSPPTRASPTSSWPHAGIDWRLASHVAFIGALAHRRHPDDRPRRHLARTRRPDHPGRRPRRHRRHPGPDDLRGRLLPPDRGVTPGEGRHPGRCGTTPSSRGHGRSAPDRTKNSRTRMTTDHIG